MVRWEESNHLQPIPGECVVIRLGRIPKDFAGSGRVSAIQVGVEEFTLSSTDKQSVPPLLSIWVEALTTPQQAYSFLRQDSPRRLVIRLSVQAIRAIMSQARTVR